MRRASLVFLTIASLVSAQDPAPPPQDAVAARAAALAEARALVEKERFAEAAPLILRAFDLGPQASGALALAARGLHEQGDRRTARGLLALAVKVDPARLDLLEVAATLALEDGSPHDAMRDAEALIAAGGGAAARVLRARALHALGRGAEARDALAALDRAGELAPELLRTLAALDLAEGLLDAAESAFLRAGSVDAADAAALAEAWLDRDDATRARAVLDRVPAAHMTPALARLRARALLAGGDPRGAADALRALEQPTDADRVLLARAQDAMGAVDAAIATLGEILARDPGVVAARAELASVRLAQGDVAAARRLVTDGLALAPHHPALVRLCDDLVPELAPPEEAAVLFTLRPSGLRLGETLVPADPAAALSVLRPQRAALRGMTPMVTLVLEGPLDAALLARTFDVLAAAGFARVSVQAP